MKRSVDIEALGINAVGGVRFTGEDTVRLAFLIHKRFGYEDDAAMAAWRRMLGNACTVEAFVAMAQAGRAASFPTPLRAEHVGEALADEFDRVGQTTPIAPDTFRLHNSTFRREPSPEAEEMAAVLICVAMRLNGRMRGRDGDRNSRA